MILLSQYFRHKESLMSLENVLSQRERMTHPRSGFPLTRSNWSNWTEIRVSVRDIGNRTHQRLTRCRFRSLVRRIIPAGQLLSWPFVDVSEQTFERTSVALSLFLSLSLSPAHPLS